MTLRSVFLKVVPWRVVAGGLAFVSVIGFLSAQPHEPWWIAFFIGVGAFTYMILMIVFAFIDVLDKTRLTKRTIIPWLWRGGYVMGVKFVDRRELNMWGNWFRIREELESKGNLVLYDRLLPFVILFTDKKSAMHFRLQHTEYEKVNIDVQKWYRARAFTQEGKESHYCDPFT